jgi:hypothetical protein
MTLVPYAAMRSRCFSSYSPLRSWWWMNMAPHTTLPHFSTSNYSWTVGGRTAAPKSSPVTYPINCRRHWIPWWGQLVYKTPHLKWYLWNNGPSIYTKKISGESSHPDTSHPPCSVTPYPVGISMEWQGIMFNYRSIPSNPPQPHSNRTDLK